MFKTEKGKRVAFLILFLGLLVVEFLIGLFVHDKWIRPYGGDVLIVILLYAFVRSFSLHKPKFLSLWIFLFALFVEWTQVFPLADVLGIHNKFVRVVMGTSFAWEDVIAYALGSVVNVFLDFFLRGACIGEWEKQTKN